MEKELTGKIKNIRIEYNEINKRLNEIRIADIQDISRKPEQKHIRQSSIRESFIHNYRTHRNGVAILHKGGEKYIKVPLISIKIYDRRSEWKWSNKIQNMEKVISFKEFYKQNKEFFVYGRNSIIKARRKIIWIKIWKSIEQG